MPKFKLILIFLSNFKFSILCINLKEVHYLQISIWTLMQMRISVVLICVMPSVFKYVESITGISHIHDATEFRAVFQKGKIVGSDSVRHVQIGP